MEYKFPVTSAQPTVRPFVCDIKGRNFKFSVKLRIPKSYWQADNRPGISTPSSKPDGPLACMQGPTTRHYSVPDKAS
jgi:hypothetical protein